MINKIKFFFKTWCKAITTVKPQDLGLYTMAAGIIMGFLTITGYILWWIMICPPFLILVITGAFAYSYTSDEFAESTIIQNGATTNQ